MIKTTIDRSGCLDRKQWDAPQRAAGEVLLQFGITPHLVGFDPLCSAIRILAERDRTEGECSFFGTQPTVSALWQDVDTEHAIRDALGVGFLGSDEIHARVFPFSDRPSSGEFVCTVAELLRDRMAEGLTPDQSARA